MRRAFLARVADYPLHRPDGFKISARSRPDAGGGTWCSLTYRCDEIELSLEFDRKGAWIDWIHLPPGLRRQGLGFALYRLAEAVAADLGCDVIAMTASGGTPRGESRLAYAVRRLGWTRTRPGSTSCFKRLERPCPESSGS